MYFCPVLSIRVRALLTQLAKPSQVFAFPFRTVCETSCSYLFARRMCRQLCMQACPSVCPPVGLNTVDCQERCPGAQAFGHFSALQPVCRLHRYGTSGCEFNLIFPCIYCKVLSDGALAQLGARHTGSVEVTGSSPVCSMKKSSKNFAAADF